MNDKSLYYRWVIRDGNELCYFCIKYLVDGWYETKEDVLQHIGIAPQSEAALFSIPVKIEETATPKWLVGKLKELKEK